VVTKALSTLETIVADFSDNLSPFSATVAKNGDCELFKRSNINLRFLWIDC